MIKEMIENQIVHGSVAEMLNLSRASRQMIGHTENAIMRHRQSVSDIYEIIAFSRNLMAQSVELFDNLRKIKFY